MSRQTLLRGFLRKSIASSMATALAASSIPPSVWARRDDDYFTNYNSQSYSYKPQQPFQNTYKPPKVAIKAPDTRFLQAPTGQLDTESRGLLRAMDALNPAKVPAISPTVTSVVKTPQTALRPITLQFKPAQVQTLKTLEVGPNKLRDNAASAPKTGMMAAFQKVFTAIGQAFAGAGQKIVNAFKAVAQMFRGNPNKEISAMAQKIGQDYSTLKEIRPGVMQTAPGVQTFVHGRMWEPGSTFQIADGKPRLIEGVTFDESHFGALSREDGKTLPIKMRGMSEGIEAVGIDFSRMNAGTGLKSSTPIEFPSVGTVQADHISYTGQKNGDPVLEIQGKGRLSVESITDPKIMRQAEQQLSIKLRLQNETFQVKDAVLTVGQERTFLNAQGEATPVNAIEKDIQGVTSLAAPLLTEAKTQATSADQNGRAINALLKNLTSQTGNRLDATLQTPDSAKAFLSSVAGFADKSRAAQNALMNEDYGTALTALPSLQANLSSLQTEQTQVTGQVMALRRFSKTLSDLTGDLRDLYPQINREGMMEQKDLRPDVLADRVARFFPEEKGRFATHTDKALVSLIALTESGQVDPATAKTWGRTLITVRNQVFGAMPTDQAPEKIAQVVIHPQETSVKAIGAGMDFAFFDYMNALSEKHPKVTGAIGSVGYVGSNVALRASQGAGIVALGYSLFAAPFVTAGSLFASWGTKKTLQAANINDDAAGFYGGTVGLLTAAGLANSASVAKAELRFKGRVSDIADDFRSGNGFLGRTLASEKGAVTTEKIALPSSTAAIQTRYGMAYQETSPQAMDALVAARSGTPLYRQGVFGKQETGDAQFWSLKNPLTDPAYGSKMGMPEKGGTGPDWVMSARLKPGAEAITRKAPGLGNNPGGDVEVVVKPGDVKIDWFNGWLDKK